jgi:hypothetical protein
MKNILFYKNKINIIPFTPKYDDIYEILKNKGLIHRISSTFLHGKLEKDVEYDIFSYSGQEITKPGIYECFIDNKKCLFYIWEVKGIDTLKGLVCYANDTESINYAFECYKNKEYSI